MLLSTDPDLMRVGIDGTMWGGEESGVAAATRRLTLELATLPRCPALTLFLAAGAADVAASFRSSQTVRIVGLPRAGALGRLVWQQLQLPFLIRSHRLDVLYSPSYTVPALAGSCPAVVTVHDLIAWKQPGLCRFRNRLHFRTLVPLSVRKARTVLVPTEAVAMDLREHLDVPAEKIRVVPWAADREIVPLPREDARRLVKRWFGIDYRYVMFTGAAESKKNLATSIAAVERAGGRLVVVGARRWGDCNRRLSAGGSSARHRFLGYVPVDQLGPLLSGADALIFPSLAEGFGLPTLESMACGTPVVASDDPAVREVCGGAALHSPANDTRALAESLRAVCENRDLRQNLIRLGHERAAQFRWDTSANRLLEALEEAASSRREISAASRLH